jgi:CheY-like chemotaxis protein
MRTVFRRILERAGFDVLESAHGDEGLDMYRHHSPAVVLMDIVMPEKDGLSTIREIRKSEAVRSLLDHIAHQVRKYPGYGISESPHQ